MKIALVCDDLIQYGGAERVTLAMCEVYKGAPLYTSVASGEWVKRCAELGIDLHTSFMQKFPFPVLLNRFYSMFLFHIAAFESFDLRQFDTVVSMSSRFAHHVITNPRTRHVCYMHSPGRMFWEAGDYFSKEFGGRLGGLRNFFLSLGYPIISLIRHLDYISAQRVNHFISNSKLTSERIKKYYNIDSDLIYPFADLHITGNDTSGILPEIPDTVPYYLVITRLVSWKKVDIAIEACANLGAKLKIIGVGPDKKRLEKLSNSIGADTEFLGYVSEEVKIQLIKGSKAVLITQMEDFGIVPLEAMTLGKPVIAYGKGGASETIISGVTGEFFYEQTTESLFSILGKFNSDKYNPQECIKRAGVFSKDRFIQEVKIHVHDVYY